MWLGGQDARFHQHQKNAARLHAQLQPLTSRFARIL